VVSNHPYDLSLFPLGVTLLEDTMVVIRPMTPEDEPALLAFFQALPDDVRYFMREDPASPQVLHQWFQSLDYGTSLPLLAFLEGQVVADATLERSTVPARRHVGELRVQVRPDVRHLGLGSVLMRQLMNLANQAGLEALTFEAVLGKEDEALHSAQWLGFDEVGRLLRAARDPQGQRYDVVVMEAMLGSWIDWWPVRVAVGQVQVRFPW